MMRVFPATSILQVTTAVICSGFLTVGFAINAPIESRGESNTQVGWSSAPAMTTTDTSTGTVQQYVVGGSSHTPVTHSANQANYSRVSQLETEIRELRGQLEEQEHQIQQLMSAQAKFFQEAGDSRLNPKTNSATTTQTVESSTEVKKSFESEQAAYEKAYMFLRAKEYPQAKYAMQTFLKQYPEGEYASNAHYWLAELSLLTGDGVLAAKEFETVIKKYPASPKVSDAMLKIGILHLEKGDKKMAKQQFEQVVTAFPNSASAGIAKKRLQAL